MSYEDLTKREALEELRQVGRLHEAATERNVELAAVIESVRALVMNTDGDYLDGDDFGGLAGEIQAVVAPVETAKALRHVKHRLLVDLAIELEQKNVAGNVSVGSVWLRSRAMRELTGVGIDRSLDKHRADGGRPA